MKTNEITFLALNGLLLGHTLEDIALSLHLEEETLLNAIGYDSMDDYRRDTEGAKKHYDLSDEEKVLLNILTTQEYLFTCLHTAKGLQLYDGATLNLIAANNPDRNAIPLIMNDFMPTIKVGNIPYAKDGILYLPEHYIKDTAKRDNLFIRVFNYKFYARPILSKKLTKILLQNLYLNATPTLTPTDMRMLISHAGSNGYLLSAVNDLLRLPLNDFIKIYNMTGAVMRYDVNEECVKLLTMVREKEKPIVVLVPPDIVQMLAKSPRLFEDSYYTHGALYVKTNVGYKPLVMQEEVLA